MRLASAFLFAGIAAQLNAAVAHADPLPAAALPADTRWVMHADVDAGRAASQLWDLARRRFIEPRLAELTPRLDVFEKVTGMKPADDLKDITLYGNAYDENAVCIRIHGMMAKETLITFLKPDPEYRETPHGTHTIISWRDKGRDRLLYASFVGNDLAYLSPSTRVIESALDTLDKTSPCLAATSPLLVATGKPILWIAGTDLTELPRAQKTESPLLAQMDAASIGISSTDDKAALEFHVTAKNDKTAQEMQAVAEGAKAFVQLAANDDHAPPGTKLLGSALSHLEVKTDGREVHGNWTVGLDKIDALLDLAPHDDEIPVGKTPAATDKTP